MALHVLPDAYVSRSQSRVPLSQLWWRKLRGWALCNSMWRKLFCRGIWARRYWAQVARLEDNRNLVTSSGGRTEETQYSQWLCEYDAAIWWIWYDSRIFLWKWCMRESKNVQVQLPSCEHAWWQRPVLEIDSQLRLLPGWLQAMLLIPLFALVLASLHICASARVTHQPYEKLLSLFDQVVIMDSGWSTYQNSPKNSEVIKDMMGHSRSNVIILG